MKNTIFTTMLSFLLSTVAIADDHVMRNASPNASVMEGKHMMNANPNASVMKGKHMMDDNPFSSHKSAKTHEDIKKRYTVKKYKKEP